MATLRDIRRRIRSVKNTKQITKAMEMVSAAKLRRAQGRLEAARPFGHKMKEMLENLAKGAGRRQETGLRALPYLIAAYGRRDLKERLVTDS